MPLSWLAIPGSEIEALEHQRHDITLDLQRCLNLPSQPVPRLAAALQRRRGEQHNEMRPRPDIFEDDAFKVATGNAVEIEEDVVAVESDSGRSPAPRERSSAIAQKYRLLDASHIPAAVPLLHAE